MVRVVLLGILLLSSTLKSSLSLRNSKVKSESLKNKKEVDRNLRNRLRQCFTSFSTKFQPNNISKGLQLEFFEELRDFEKKLDSVPAKLFRNNNCFLPSTIFTTVLLATPAALQAEFVQSVNNNGLGDAWMTYAFMFPVSILVASLCQLAGIGGAALFAPLFVLVFPLLGPEYPLASTQASLATALVNEAFGFSSGLVGYSKKGLVDVSLAVPYLAVSLPFSFLGGQAIGWLDEFAVKAAYSLLMLTLAIIFLKSSVSQQEYQDSTSQSIIHNEGTQKMLTSADGVEYKYQAQMMNARDIVLTAAGAFMTGIAGVGIGEVVVPQLTQKNRIPIPVASGTSILIVCANAVVAAYSQITSLMSSNLQMTSFPLNLICYTVPGVIIGGQIAPNLQGRFSKNQLEGVFGLLFLLVGCNFGVISFNHYL